MLAETQDLCVKMRSTTDELILHNHGEGRCVMLETDEDTRTGEKAPAAQLEPNLKSDKTF